MRAPPTVYVLPHIIWADSECAPEEDTRAELSFSFKIRLELHLIVISKTPTVNNGSMDALMRTQKHRVLEFLSSYDGSCLSYIPFVYDLIFYKS